MYLHKTRSIEFVAVANSRKKNMRIKRNENIKKLDSNAVSDKQVFPALTSVSDSLPALIVLGNKIHLPNFSLKHFVNGLLDSRHIGSFVTVSTPTQAGSIFRLVFLAKKTCNPISDRGHLSTKKLSSFLHEQRKVNKMNLKLDKKNL